MTKCDPRRPILGELNPLEFRRDADLLREDTNAFDAVLQAVTTNFKPRSFTDKSFKAICLKVEETGKEPGSDNGFSWKNWLGLGTNRIKVYARIPELHASLADPCVYGNIEADDRLIYMHPVFLGRVSQNNGILDSSNQVPTPGDIIWVEFEDTGNQTQGVYLGICQHFDAQPPKLCTDSFKSFQEGNSVGTIGTNADMSTPNDELIFILPAAGVITSTYGPRNVTGGSKFHEGTDIDGVDGVSVVRAPSTCRITRIDVDGIGKGAVNGNCIIMNDIINSGYTHALLHLHSLADGITVGATVKMGQEVGLIGKTGRVVAGKGGDGSHLHWQVTKDGKPGNPLFITAAARSEDETKLLEKAGAA